MKLTFDQLLRKLDDLEVINSPEVVECLFKESAVTAGVSKQYCTPGHSPYWKAPYSDDRDEDRQLVHMRDMIDSTVRVDLNEKKMAGVIFVRDSGEGHSHHYALYVHEGTYDYYKPDESGEISFINPAPGMKGMPPRRYLTDAVKVRQQDIRNNLCVAIWKHMKRVAGSEPK